MKVILAKLQAIHSLPGGAVADGAVLAEFTAQGTAAEENGTATAGAGQGRLLPMVKRGTRNVEVGADAAPATGNISVYSATVSTKLTGIIHFAVPPFLLYFSYCLTTLRLFDIIIEKIPYGVYYG